MALKLYVRGASADVDIVDLGVTIAQGPSWTQLNYSTPSDAEADAGQFTARELRDSGDLFDLVAASTLEWSKDGSTVEAAGDYKADYMLTEDFTDDRFDLSNGELITPQGTNLPASGVEGQQFWDSDDDLFYLWDGDEWVTPGSQGEASGEETGFENRTDSAISFVDGTRTFTIQPTGTNYDIFFSGRKVTKDAVETVVIPDTEGIHYIYFDDADDTLKSTTTFSSDLILRDVFVAAIYWDADNNKQIIFAEERHGITMDGSTHYYLHSIFGAQWSDGLALGNMSVDQAGDDDDHAQFAVTDGTIYDEDIKIDINDGSPQDLDPDANIPIFYKESASADWRVLDADAYPVADATKVGSGSRIHWNEWTGSTWQLTEVTDGQYMLMHYFATNDVNTPVVAIVGESEYATLGAAQSASTSEINNIVVDGLPAKEFVALATVIYQTDNTYTNTPKARVVSTAEGDDYIDWRFTVVNPGGGVSTSDHGQLTGLGDDDHVRYFDLTGDKSRNVVSSADGVTWNGDFDATSGIITIPNAADVPGTFTSGGEGDIAWDSDDDLPYWHDGNDWVSILDVLSGVLDHETLLNIGTNTHSEIDTHIADSSIHLPADHDELGGLGDDDHTQYVLKDGDLTRNQVTGGVDYSSASGLILPNGTDTTGQSTTEGNIFWDSDDDELYVYNGTEWVNIGATIASGVVDHGELAGLADDDHPQYLNETRHDALPADNPHSVTFTQAVTADSGTDITAAEAETLSDGSNADSLHVHTASGVSLSHSDLSGIGTDDHHTRYTDAEAIAAVGPHFSGDHNDLTNLDTDDHTQYVIIDGDLTRNTFTDGGLDLASASGLIVPTGTDRTGLAEVEGNIMWDTDDDQPWFYDGNDWISIPTILSGLVINTDHGGLFGLGDDDHTQYVSLDGDNTRNAITGSLDLSGGDQFTLPQATDVNTLTGKEGSIAWDTDDEILYMHDGTNWIGVAPASGIITDHGNLNGLDDDDHPQYTAWAQEETVTGVWTFDPVDAEPNLILDPRPSAPTNNLVDGAITVVDGVLYTYDATRTAWLSVDRTTYFGGRNGNANNIYLRTADNVATSATGFRMLRDATITGLFAQTEGVESWTFEVRDSAGSVLASLVISGADGGQDSTINVDVSAGDEIRLYVNGTGVMRPVAGFEVAWRI